MKVSPSVKPADEKLVAWACDGSHEAFEELIERHKQKAYRIAFGFARDREAAKDLSQDAFLKAFINLKNFDGRSGFYTWFYRILVNVCLDHKRRQSRRMNEEFNEAVENQLDPSHSVAAPPTQRTAFVLKNHQGLSIREIAEVMESAEGTVKVHLYRAVTALRQNLAEFA